MTVRRLDHVGVVVSDLDAATAFFVELGLEVQGDAPEPVAGEWVDTVVGMPGVEVDIRFVAAPDGRGRLELTQFRNPEALPGSTSANTLGLRRLMFAVDDVDDTVARLRAVGGELVGEVAQYEDRYRLCYLRGPDDIIVALAEELH